MALWGRKKVSLTSLKEDLNLDKESMLTLKRVENVVYESLAGDEKRAIREKSIINLIHQIEADVARLNELNKQCNAFLYAENRAKSTGTLYRGQAYQQLANLSKRFPMEAEEAKKLINQIEADLQHILKICGALAAEETTERVGLKKIHRWVTQVDEFLDVVKRHVSQEEVGAAA